MVQAKTPCKRCGEGRSRYKGSLCGRCFRASGGKTGKCGRVVSDANAGVSPQLDAIRRAMRWDREEMPKNPTVRFFVELRAANPRELTLQWERLEREHRLSQPAAPQPALPPVAALDPKPAAAAVEEDVVGEKLEAMIEAWLAETGKRVAGTCPCCGQKVKSSSPVPGA